MPFLHLKQLEGSEQERSLDFLAIFESVHMPKFNYFWTLSKMAEKIKGSFLLWALQLCEDIFLKGW